MTREDIELIADAVVERMGSEQLLVSVKVAAGLLDIGVDRMRDLVRSGAIAHVVVNNKVQIVRKRLVEWVERHTQGAGAQWVGNGHG